MKNIKLNNKIQFSNNLPFVLIAGPCIIETDEIIYETVETLISITDELNIPFVFKSSFDKANRSSIDSYRGPGLIKGLELLDKVKQKYNVPILIDIHTPEHAEPVSQVADILQIPAFLCRQTDLNVAAAKTGKIVNIKKGQFLAPWDMKNLVKKIESQGNNNIMLTERGVCFGYNRWVVDMCSLYEMSKTEYPVIFDATHSVQLPGGAGTHSGGVKEYIPVLSKSAVATGIAGLYIETHPDPDKALSDGKNMLALKNVKSLLKKLKDIDGVIKND
jgi:2-dehydro-3-deoxyphosphooctonate aldolase (KDO 8-P synthase)